MSGSEKQFIPLLYHFLPFLNRAGSFAAVGKIKASLKKGQISDLKKNYGLKNWGKLAQVAVSVQEGATGGSSVEKPPWSEPQSYLTPPSLLGEPSK